MDLDHRIASVLAAQDDPPSPVQMPTNNAYGKYHGGQCGPRYNILLDDATFYYDDPPEPPPMSHPHAQTHSYSNLIEIQSQPAEPFVVQKGNVLEIVPKGEVASKDAAATAAAAAPTNQPPTLSEIELAERSAQRKEQRARRKQERDKKRLEKFMRKEKLKLEIKSLLESTVSLATDEDGEQMQDDDEDTAEQVVVKAVYNPNAPLGKSCLRPNTSASIDTDPPTPVPAVAKPKTVLFADGIRPGDGTSASDSDDTTPLPLRDRNKRAIKKRLDSRQRKKMEKALGIKTSRGAVAGGKPEEKYGHDQVASKLYIDPELENMPPPSPPAGEPPAYLPQPTLKASKEDESVPRMIYFHYDPKVS